MVNVACLVWLCVLANDCSALELCIYMRRNTVLVYRWVGSGNKLHHHQKGEG